MHLYEIIYFVQSTEIGLIGVSGQNATSRVVVENEQDLEVVQIRNRNGAGKNAMEQAHLPMRRKRKQTYVTQIHALQVSSLT